ncbi:MAG: hypothetical protein AAF989_07960, partial [Planctomycetota bacterium]
IQPGLAEFVLNRLDGQTEIRPIATNLRIGENSLARSNHVEILRDLEPVKAEFIDVGQWNAEANQAGTSTVSLVLLALLAMFLAIEQALAYWASYHSEANPKSARQRVASRQGGEQA